jgi:glutamine synthetase
MLKALAGDPVLLAASDAEELTRRYKLMCERCNATEQKMELSYDAQCEVLADHFLSDYVNVIDADREDLARHIQQAIEDWFFMREDLKGKS